MSAEPDVPPITAREVALRAHAAGLCVVPPKEDGSKTPMLDERGGWKGWQISPPTREQLLAWYRARRTGVGILTGSASGGVLLFEFEQEATHVTFRDTAESIGMGDLVARIEAGYCEQTPGGGIHWLFRCADGMKSTPLARYRSDELDEQGRPKIKPLIETKGEGGYAVIAPSWGRVHPSGRPYVLLTGSVETIAQITPAERDELYRLARAFDALPRPEAGGARATSAERAGDRPGDDFNRRATWAEVLEPHGWTMLYRHGDKGAWRRPGKPDPGISATTNWHDSDLLYVFSTSTPFNDHEGYSKWRAWAVLNCAGDWSRAAGELAKLGYGSRDYRPPTPALRLHRGGADGETAGGEGGEGGEEPPELPVIDAGNLHLPSVAADAWAALELANEPPFLFRYGGMPTRVETPADEPPLARTLTEDRLRHVLARVATWRKWSRDEYKPALPPVHVVRDMLAAPAHPLPPLLAIIEAPAFAPDGSLHDRPGYHAAGQTYLAPASGFGMRDVPPRPTPDDAARARALIVDELLGDFPFVGDAERAHAVALLLLPFVRGLIEGPTPLHLIEKPTPGTGASLLADALTYPAIGRPAAAMTEGRDEDEWRKRVTAKLATGASVVLIDNLRGRLASAALASVITSTTWEDRILGKSENVLIPVRCAWIATGNNPALSSELTRRTIRIRLNAQTDRPWLRTEFRHPNLRGWAREQRGELVWAALTLARAWLAAGRPDAGATVLGMFEGWSRVLGGILATADIPGFLTNLDDFYDESDGEGAEIRGFLAAWWEKHHAAAVGVADLFPLATASDSTLNLGSGSEQAQKTRLGRLLRELKDRHYQLTDDLTVRVAAGGTLRRAVLWRLEQPGITPAQRRFYPASCEVGEVCEVLSPPARTNTDQLSIDMGGKTSQTSPTSHDGGSDDDDLDY